MPSLPTAITLVCATLLVGCSTPGTSATAAAQPEARPADCLPSLPRLSNANLQQWVAQLEPADEELAYQAIDWIPDFATGLRAADRRQLPMFFWAMNGHPLGCT